MTIPNVTNDPVVSADATVAALDLGAGAILTINSGQTVTVDGLSTFAGSSISGGGNFSTTSLNLLAGSNGNINLNAFITATQFLTVTNVGVVNGSAINIGGDLISNDADLNGTTVFRLFGSGDQTLTGSGRLHNLDIAKPSSDVLIASDFTIAGGTLSGTSSRLKNVGGVIIFGAQTISFTGSIDDVNLNGGSNQNIILNSDLTVNNNLTVTNVGVVNGNAINISGDLVSNDADLNGTTVFRLVGSGDQTLTGSGRLHNLDIAKPSGDVLIPSDFTITGGTLSGTSSRLKNVGGVIIFGAQTISFTGSIDDVDLNGGSNQNVILNSDLTVNNYLTVTNVSVVNGSAINISGDLVSNDADLAGTTVFRLVGSVDQTLTGSGRLHNLNVSKGGGDVLIASDFTIAGGTLSGTSSRLKNVGGVIIFGAQTISFTGSIDDVDLNGGSNQHVILNSDLTVNNNLTVTNVGVVNGSAINIGGDLVSNDADLAGTTVFRLAGSGDQTLTGSGRLHNLNVSKGGGDVLIPSDFTIAGGTLSGTSSRLKNVGGVIIFGAQTISFTGSIDDVNLNGGSNQNVILNSDLTVNNNLTVTNVGVVNGNAINISGDLVSNDADLAGTTVFRLAGSGDQTLTGSGRLHNLDIAKPSGDVLIPSDFTIAGGTLSGTSSRLKNVGGVIIFGAQTISFTGSIDDVNLNGGSNQNIILNSDLTVNNNLTVTNVGVVNGSKLNVFGIVTSSDADMAGSAFVRLSSSSDQLITGTGKIANLEVAKGGGQALFTSNRTFNAVVITSGNFAPNGFTVTSPVTVNGGTLGGQGKIVGNVTVNSGGTLNAGSSPGRLDIQGNVVMGSGSNFFVDVNGNIPAVEHDQVVVTGTVTINGATLTGTTGIAPSQPITILVNDNTDAIAGTRFVNAPNTGNMVLIGGVDYLIAYNGSSGNDLVLNPPPPTGLQAFNSSPSKAGQTTAFTATLTAGRDISYTWNFGDGTVLETSDVATHTYGSVGDYTAIVTATNSAGSISTTTAVTITPSGEVVIALTPATPATLLYNALDGASVKVEVSGEAITQSLYLVYNSVITPTTPPSNLRFANRAFHLEAWLGNQILSGISFDPPLTVTLDYLAGDVSGLNEEVLELDYFDTTANQWSNEGMSVVERDTVNHRIVVSVNHLTEFALFQPALPPVVTDDADLTLVNTVLSVFAPGVLANDSDPEGSPLSAQLVTPPVHGIVNLASNGGFVYTPTTDYTGMDSFIYSASDGEFVVTGTVTINVFQPGNATGPIVLPAAGWNLFGYPLANSHPVTEVLASVSGVYSTVFGYDASDANDPWRMYDPNLSEPFASILNRLSDFEYGHGYWINLSQPATITLPSGVMAANADGLKARMLTPQPPATFYGELTASNSFAPRAGMVVEALIGDSLCGKSTTQVLDDGTVVYALHVQSAGNGATQNCGIEGRDVTLIVDGQMLVTLPWSNGAVEQVQTTQPEEPTISTRSIYLPLVANH